MEPALATIVMFAADFAPKNWAFCYGQLLSIQQNSAVFSLLGTTYGGNGIQTFALPDLRGRTPIGVGQGPGLPSVSWGETAGVNQVTLTTFNMPSHTHPATLTVGANTQNANTEEPDGANPASGVMAYAPGPASSLLGGVSTTIGNAGGNQPMSIQQPYIGIHFIICLAGIYPSRS